MSGYDLEPVRHVFDPSDIDAMRCALDQALEALSFAYHDNDEPDMMTREELARAILRYASRGEVDPRQLTARALYELAPRPAYWVVHQSTRDVA